MKYPLCAQQHDTERPQRGFERRLWLRYLHLCVFPLQVFTGSPSCISFVLLTVTFCDADYAVSSRDLRSPFDLNDRKSPCVRSTVRACMMNHRSKTLWWTDIRLLLYVYDQARVHMNTIFSEGEMDAISTTTRLLVHVLRWLVLHIPQTSIEHLCGHVNPVDPFASWLTHASGIE